MSPKCTPEPGSDLEDFHKCLRRLEKFKSKKLYKMFDPKYWNKKFRDVNHPLFDKLAPIGTIKEYNENLDTSVHKSTSLIEAASANEDVDAIVNDLYDSEFVESFTEFEQQ